MSEENKRFIKEPEEQPTNKEPVEEKQDEYAELIHKLKDQSDEEEKNASQQTFEEEAQANVTEPQKDHAEEKENPFTISLEKDTEDKGRQEDGFEQGAAFQKEQEKQPQQDDSLGNPAKEAYTYQAAYREQPQYQNQPNVGAVEQAQWQNQQNEAQQQNASQNKANKNGRIHQIKYRIGLQDWVRISERERKRKQTSKVIYILCFVFGGLFLLATLLSVVSQLISNLSYSYYDMYIEFDLLPFVLGVLLIVLPFCMMSIEKNNAKKYYINNAIFRSELTLNFYEGYFEQISVAHKEAFRWGYIHSLADTPEAYVIYTNRVPTTQGLFIPKAALSPQDSMMVDRIFTYIAGKYQKIYFKNYN